MADRVSGAFDVIRIDEHRIEQLTSCASEPAKNQNSLLVMARSDKFLGNQVHAIVQSRNHADVCGPIIAQNLAMTEMPFQKDDGFPGTSLETPVDSFRFRFDISKQVMVTLDVSAARSADLQEAKLALISRPLLQHALDRQEPFQYSLGVVHAIDTHTHE